MPLADYLVSDAAATVGNANDHAEPVVYIPVDQTKPRRPINVIVRRFSLTPGGLSGDRATSPKMIVYVVNDSTLGISSAEINYGGDRLLVAFRPGTKSEMFLIQHPGRGDPEAGGNVETIDAAMLTLWLN